MLSSCLITQPVHFDEPANSPPAIYDLATGTYSRTQIILLSRLDPSGGDAGVPPMTTLTLEVEVFDADVDQRLSWIAYIDDDNGAPCTGCSGDLAPTGNVRRTLTANIPLATITAVDPSCHRVDLYVSSSFMPGLHQPRQTGDVDVATWWIRVQSDAGDNLQMSTCPGR